MGVEYATMVSLRQIPACSKLILACERFLKMYRAAKKGGAEYYWSDEHAIEPCAFIETLCHVKGRLAKTPFIMEPWQIWKTIAIYGFRWRDTGLRVVTIVYLEITRKSGKSLWAAGIAHYELGPNAYVGDDLFIIAPTKDLANKVLEPMTKMVEFNDDFQDHFGIKTYAEKIEFNETESYAVTLSAAGKKQDGHDPKVVIGDEFHSLPASIFNVMKSSQGARDESLFMEIGSAGYNAFGVGWEERQVAVEVLEGKRDKPELFAAIWGIDDTDHGNWRNERVIRKANPNFGISNPKRKTLQDIEEIYTNPRNKSEVLRTRYNIWGLGEAKLISRDDWDLCFDPDISRDDFYGETGWAGIDLATRLDMVCWAAMFELDARIAVFARHYVPEKGPWREDEEISAYYEMWYEQGWLTFTPGSYHSYDEITTDLYEIAESHNIEAFGVDDREANALMSSLAKKNLPVLSHRKNAANYSEPTKHIQAVTTGLVKGLVHDGNPVLAWNVENTIGASNTAELILPKKVSEHSTMRIDGFDAMVIANACRLETADKRKLSRPNSMAVHGVRIIDDN